METNTENPEPIIFAFKDEMKKLLNTAIDEAEIDLTNLDDLAPSIIDILFSKPLTLSEEDVFRDRFDSFFKKSSGYEISNRFQISAASLSTIIANSSATYCYFLFFDLTQSGDIALNLTDPNINRLYYLIIISKEKKLGKNHNFENDEIYVVKDDYKLYPIELSSDMVNQLRSAFLNNLGEEINKITKPARGITEYIRYTTDAIYTYINKLPKGADNLYLHLLCIANSGVKCGFDARCLKNVYLVYPFHNHRLMFSVRHDANIKAAGREEGSDAGNLRP